MARAAAPGQSDNVPAGIGYVVLAIFLFSGINVVVKWLAAAYPVTELLFFRNLFGLVPCLWLVAQAGGTATLRTTRWDLHLTRGVLGVTSLGLFFWSLDLMPMADAQALSFAAPLFLTALSVPLLGEKVGPWRWGAVLVGFAGVVLAAMPGRDAGALNGLGALVGIGSALLFALAMLSIRRMARTEASAAITFYYTAICAAVTAPFVLVDWVVPSVADLGALAAAGLAGGLGQYCLTRAFALAPASATAPFNYTAMIWAMLFGYVFWGEVPGTALLAGTALVVASGLVILWRERRRPSVTAPATQAADDPVGPTLGRS